MISFSLKGNSGKNKATREKSRFLNKKADSFKLYSIDEVKVFTRNNKIFKLIRLFIFEIYYIIKTIINKRKPDTIFSRSFFCFGTYTIAKIYKANLIREKHGDFYEEALILFKQNLFMKIVFRIIQNYKLFFLKRSSGVIFNNPTLEDSFNNQFQLKNYTKTISIYNGSNTEDFYIMDIDNAKKILGLNDEFDYFLFIGSMSKWHGVDLLLNVFKDYKLKYNDKTKLLMVGGKNNTYFNTLKDEYKSDNIIFTGQVPIKKAKYYINASLICLLPTSNNRTSPGSPLKLFDYIACGKPIITQQKTKGYSDIVNKYNLGITCDFNKTKDAVGKINSFYKNLNINYYKKNNREVAENKLNWSNVIDKWLDFANEL